MRLCLIMAGGLSGLGFYIKVGFIKYICVIVYLIFFKFMLKLFARVYRYCQAL